MAIQLVSVLLASLAGAQEIRREPAHKLSLELDLPLVLLSSAIASSFLFVPEKQVSLCTPTCDRSRINAFDRPAAGLYNPTWYTVGDVAAAATIAFPLVVIVIDEGLANGLNDDIVVGEAALVSSALQVSLSYAVARPRPLVYRDDVSPATLTNADSARSFFSGHVATTVATSVAALRTFQRLGKPGLGWAVLAAGLAGSTLVGVARVASGAHFPSDVIAGAAIGTGVGLVLPAVHDPGPRLVPVAGSGVVGLTVSGVIP